MADHKDDLDELLDSALDDFQSLNLAPSSQRPGLSSIQSLKSKFMIVIVFFCGYGCSDCVFSFENRSGNGNKDGDKEQGSSPSLPTGVRGLGMGLPDLKSKKKGKQKVSAQDTHVAAEALDKLREQAREAVKGLESVAGAKPEDFNNDAMMEDWVKQFEELAGSQDMESMVESMMQQLLSKEILYEPMKEIAERYPKWLEVHQASLSKEEYGRYFNQYELIKNLNEVYENDPNNFTKIVDLMQKMQECGQPPNDIVQELAPDIDFANLGQLSPEMLESQANCSIM